MSSKSIIIKNENDNRYEYSDSEDEREMISDEVEHEINFKIQDKFNSDVKNYRTFMNATEFSSSKEENDYNIIDRNCLFDNRLTAKSYTIPDDQLYKLFRHLETCRRKQDFMMVAERQLEYSGMMIDIDIELKSSKSTYDSSVYQVICNRISNILRKYIDLENPDKPYTDNKLSIYFAVTKKPAIKYDMMKKVYKNGFHILIPGIQVTKAVKKFILKKCIEERVLDVFEDLELIDGKTIDNLIDMNAAHVPVFFVGSSSKPGTPAYELHSIYSYDISIDKISSFTHDMIASIVNKRFGYDEFDMKIDLQKTAINICNEFSLNWETSKKKRAIIIKRKYEIREAYLNDITILTNTDTTTDSEIGELSILNIHDPDADYISKLLDTLSSKRYTDFGEWFKVLCVLAHTSKSYKPLAEAFSMKCIEKFNQSDFEHHWQSACTDKVNKLNIGSLHFWAKNDNPVRYDLVRQESVYNMVYRKIFDRQVEGSLQHYDIAQILSKSLKHKYAFDIDNGGIWYEFILEEDIQAQGEVFKWRSYNKSPNSMKKYTSEILPRLFDKVFDKMDSMIDASAANGTAKYNIMVKNNLKVTCRKLKDSGFKSGIIREAEQLFEKIKFAETLDKDPLIMGVGNGILKLDKTVQFITGYHNYAVSKHTKVKYIDFNPYNPVTKKVLYVVRNLFPDDEPDTFLFMMCYFAAALDGKKKESLLLLLIGGGSNGKSFLLELFKETIGAAYGVKMPLSFLISRQKNAEGATPATMMLKDARIAHYSESMPGDILHMAKVKEVTGQETLSGRKNYGDMMNFKPTCHHLVTSNFDFNVNGGDHGTWRRLKRVSMRMKFCKPDDDYDPNNPYERMADIDIGVKWPEDPDVQSAFLSILCYYYEILQNEYGGIVENVPHPNVRLDTEKYRDRQDKVNNFINIRFVKTVDPDHCIPMSTIIEKYTKWYDGLYPDDKEYKKSIGYQFENSKLGKIISKTRTGVFVNGYRILENGEEPEEGETYLMDTYTDKKNQYKKVVPETADEFYSNICTDYEVKKGIKEKLIKEEMTKLQKIKMQAIRDRAAMQSEEQVQSSSKDTNVLTSSPDNDTYDKSGFKEIKKHSNEFTKDDIKEFIGESESDSEDESEDSEDSE